MPWAGWIMIMANIWYDEDDDDDDADDNEF